MHLESVPRDERPDLIDDDASTLADSDDEDEFDIESALDEDYDPGMDGDGSVDEDDMSSGDYGSTDAPRDEESDEEESVAGGSRHDEVDFDNDWFDEEPLNVRVEKASRDRRLRSNLLNEDDGTDSVSEGNEEIHDDGSCEFDLMESVLEEGVCAAPVNVIDCPNFEEPPNPAVPTTNAGEPMMEVLHREEDEAELGRSFPMHVLFNQAGSLCTRYNRRITGTQSQTNFVQMLVSTIRGVAMPLLYFMATLFPRHFWCSATHEPAAVLGSAPISCYTNKTHPNGFASSLQIARNLSTSASSSTANCHVFMSFLYDIQANQAMSGIDSRQVTRMGFRVETKSKVGLGLADGDESRLNESKDSRQMTMNLSASSQWDEWDYFYTMTGNQAQFPGIRHLHEFKESMRWTWMIKNFDHLPLSQQQEIKRSYEMAYTSVLGRCWMEARKLVRVLCLYCS